jgi:uncharacterized protein (TIGR03435 family)
MNKCEPIDFGRRLDGEASYMKKFLNLAASLFFTAAAAFAPLAATPNKIPPQQQNTTASVPAYEFETASIKPNKSNVTSFRAGFTTDGYRAEDLSVKYFIQVAYGVQDYRISGLTDWLDSEHFDIEAKMDPSVADALSKLTPSQLESARQQMLQSLLAERFNLKIHRESKEGPVYFLTIGKNGPKLQEAKSGNALAVNADGTPARYRIVIGPGNTTYAYSTTMKSLADFLARQLSRPVLDKTDLTGIYDFSLDWVPEAAPTSPPDAANGVTLPGVPGASLFSALQQQLGLKLEPGKSPIEVIVIDHVERPSGN